MTKRWTAAGVRALAKDLKAERDALAAIAEAFRTGTYRSSGDGETLECYHCEATRSMGAGFYSQHHDDDCPVRRLNDWFLNRDISVQQGGLTV